jgi:hypothetical protein
MKETYDIIEFKIWVLDNLHLVLNPKQMLVFHNNGFTYDDLKLFSKLERAHELIGRWSTSRQTRIGEEIDYDGDGGQFYRDLHY